MSNNFWALKSYSNSFMRELISNSFNEMQFVVNNRMKQTQAIR